MPIRVPALPDRLRPRGLVLEPASRGTPVRRRRIVFRATACVQPGFRPSGTSPLQKTNWRATCGAVWMWTEDHEKSTETNHGRTDTGSTTDGQRDPLGCATRGPRHNEGPLAKKALPTKGCRDDALACPCLFGPVWLAFGEIFRDDCPEPTFQTVYRCDCPRTHVETQSGWPSDFRRPLFCFCFSLAEPTLKRIAGGRRIFALRFFVFASPSGLGRLSAVIAPKLTHSGWPSDFRRPLFCFCFSLGFGAVPRGDCPRTHV